MPKPSMKKITAGQGPTLLAGVKTEAGQFPIMCSEYCGDGHGDMKGALMVRAEAGPAPQEKN